MAKDQATAEKVETNTPHPSEKMFLNDHPELISEKPVDKAAKKSAFEAGLDEAIETVVEPKPKEEIKEDEKPAEPEEKPSETPSKEEAQPSTPEDKVVTAGDDKVINDYADKNGISVEKAREEIEEYRAIALKYKNDPIELAKAYKNIQSVSDKQKADETTAQQTKLASEIMTQGAEAFVAKAERENAPKWVEEYRKVFPAKSEAMTDAAIIEECRQQAIVQVRQQMGTYQLKLKEEATTKRESLIKALKDEDRPFVSEISRVLRGLPDTQVVDKNFNFEDLTRWGRGDTKNIERIKKESYERGFKAAKSGDIVGEIVIAKPTGGSKPKPKESRPAEEQLSSYERRQANEQYASIQNEEERYAAFLDVKRSRKPKEK